MIYGYARVSTKEQNLDMQLDALNKMNCDEIFQDHGVSGTKASRPEFDAMLEKMTVGDTLVVYKLDRLGRRTKNLLDLIDVLKERKINLVSIQDKIDTTTPHGKLFFTMQAAFAECERDVIVERVKAGQAAYVKRGGKLGKPLSLSEIQIRKGKRMRKDGVPVAVIAEKIGTSQATAYRYVQRGII